MSIETWKAKFYPVPADKPKTKRAALLHSIRKWQGLSKDNLAKHTLEQQEAILFSEDTPAFWVNGSSCALCVLYAEDDDWEKTCPKCPLFKVRGGVCCDKKMPREEMHPYVRWLESGDNKPMLKWLRRALKMVDATTAARKRR